MSFSPENGSSAPLGAEEFSLLMVRLGLPSRLRGLAVAVSGGADSMALALLARHWCAENKVRLVAFTVDHGLRPESLAEAKQVAAWMKARGVPCRILSWRGEKPRSRIEEKAREARYALLRAACARGGITHLLLAHHAHDQAETVLMRFAGGSGIDGLAGMAAVSEMEGLTLLRPLLPVLPSRLRATCRAHFQEWVEDPTNGSEAFARGRLRKSFAILQREGLTATRLLRLAARAQRMAQAAREMADAAWEMAFFVRQDEVLLGKDVLFSLPEEIRLRLIEQALLTLSPEAPLRQHRLEALADVIGEPGFRRRTLAGCVISSSKGNLHFRREKLAIGRHAGIKGKQVVKKAKGAGS